MHCTQCGTENSADSKFCMKCGGGLAATHNETPIWNPSTIAGLSFVFSPAFGSFLQASNWRALGQPERAASSKRWFYISLLFLIICAGLSAYLAGDHNASAIVNGVALLYFIVWHYASGRLQVKHVKDILGKKFQKRSFVKPVLIALPLSIVYVALVVGLLIATHSSGDDGEQNAAASNGSSFSFASLFGGHKLDCAAGDVKQIIMDNYAEQLVGTGVPDLVMGIERKRIKFHVEMVTETARNEESKNVQCSAKLVIEFPKEDLDRAAQTKESKMAELSLRNYKAPSDPVFSAMVTYVVLNPADEAEKKNGPIVKMTLRNDANQGDLGPYVAAYTLLSYSAPDITASSKNDKPWDKDFKTAVTQECSKTMSAALCACKFDQLEKWVSQDEMHRIGHTLATNPLMANKYINFITVSDALTKQCPATQSIANLLAARDGATDSQATTAVEGTAVDAEKAAPQPVEPAQQAAPQVQKTVPE